MKKNSSSGVSEKREEKGVFYQAGEIIGSIGFHIVDGKDKVIGVIKKKLGKKQKPESKTGRVAKKKVSGRAGQKTTKSVKKPAKKSNPAKVVRKKTDKDKKISKSDGEKS